jgi:hypothetical protein
MRKKGFHGAGTGTTNPGFKSTFRTITKSRLDGT